MSWLNKMWQKLGSSPGKNRLSLRPKSKYVDLTLKPPSMEPINTFTPRAEQVLALAQQEAEQLQHTYVGTEHVLLGLLAMGPGVAVNFLLRRGITLEAVRTNIAKQVGPSVSQKIVAKITYTPEVKRILAQASEEAQTLRHTYVGLEHIMLALIAEPGDVLSKVFKHFVIDQKIARQVILRELDPNFHPAPPSLTPAPAVPTPQKPASVAPPAPQKTPAPQSASQPVKPPQPVSSVPVKKTLPAPKPQPVKSSVPAKPTAPSSVPKSSGNTSLHHRMGTVDIAKRFDIYCADRGQEVTVYRNARFKSVQQLFQRSSSDPNSSFFEIELESGQTVFVPQSSVIRFEECAAVAGR